MSALDRLARLITDHSTVLFLGGTDVGKTTLIRQIHERVGGEVVDADLGQAEIGPPAVISLGTYRGGPRAGYFCGDISPRGSFLEVLTGIHRMQLKSARPCLIDTDGYIGEGAARAFKSEILNLVQPDLLVLLQRGGELDYYKLFTQKGVQVFDLRVEHPGSKLREERIRAREVAFRSYFAQAQLQSWHLNEVRFERALLGHGEPLQADALSRLLGCPVSAGWQTGRQAVIVVRGFASSLGATKLTLDADYIQLIHDSDLQNLLLGCQRGGEFEGMGILTAISSEQVEVLTPTRRATVLQVGSLRVRPDGSHGRARLSF
ncbi:MAG: Clp1/GlmU family protein [Candidatus Binatia bacterium]